MVNIVGERRSNDSTTNRVSTHRMLLVRDCTVIGHRTGTTVEAVGKKGETESVEQSHSVGPGRVKVLDVVRPGTEGRIDGSRERPLILSRYQG